jgi:alpha-glucosidase
LIGFSMQDGGIPAYRIDYLGRPVVLESRLGLEPDFMDGFEVTGVSTNRSEGQWTNSFGERKVVPDNYRELNVDLKHAEGRLVRLTFRAYNEGAALRYTFPAQSLDRFLFSGERTEFRFPPQTYGYSAYGTEDEYRRIETAQIQPYCERPLTLEYANGLFACVTEAANTDYPRMMLSPLADVPGALVSALGGNTSNTAARNMRHDPTVTVLPPFSSPWRMVVVGQKAGDLLERNYLMLNLNPPNALADTSWIKPGKVIREVTLSTAGGLACVDFAATHGLQYVHFDAGWYGPEGSTPTAASVHPSRDLDLPRVIEYGASKGIGVTLYVNKLALTNQIDILPALYRNWGVKGIKFGFVNVGPQQDTRWLLEAIRRCAANQIMVNVHDGYRATGCERTYPNLMTVEGIRGNEHMPTPEHNCTLPFTRYVGGIGDYTVCYYNNRIQTTHAHQLAMAVVSFSPLQWVFWYDRPSDCRDEPEIEFFREVPTVWDDTRVINGEIGRFATIARQSGDDWFIGTINDSEARQLQVPLDFLVEGRSYTANIYFDDETVPTRTRVGIERRPVNSQTILNVPLRPAGGQAVWIHLPEDPESQAMN